MKFSVIFVVTSKLREDDDLPYNHVCDNMRLFMQTHRGVVHRIKHRLESLSRDVRIELMQWLLGREVCGMRFADLNSELITTKWSLSLAFARVEYGKMMYPKKSGLCAACGILCTK